MNVPHMGLVRGESSMNGVESGTTKSHGLSQQHSLFAGAFVYPQNVETTKATQIRLWRKSPPMTFRAVEPVVDFTRFSHWIGLRKNRITEKHSIKHGFLPTKECVLPISPLCGSENAGYPQFVAIFVVNLDGSHKFTRCDVFFHVFQSKRSFRCRDLRRP